MAISVIVVPQLTRVFATHPSCKASEVLHLPNARPEELLPIEGGIDAIAAPAVRVVAPHAVLFIEMTASLTTDAGPVDFMDLHLKNLLGQGFVLLTALDDDVPRVAGWNALLAGESIRVTSADDVPLYEGPLAQNEPWADVATRAGELVIISGTVLGLRDVDPMRSIKSAISSGGVVGGIVSLSTAISRVPRNSPCPCGSGRKYKQCHGR